MKLTDVLVMKKRLDMQGNDISALLTSLSEGVLTNDTVFCNRLENVLRRAAAENLTLKQEVDEALAEVEVPVKKSLEWLGVQK